MKTLNLCFKTGAALSGLAMAASMLTVIWLPDFNGETSELFRRIFVSGLVSALVCVFGVLFTWDGRL